MPTSQELISERRWIWPFELLDKLGEGGMGVVYRARYVKNDRVVAVKLLPSSITDETMLSRFEREMQLLRTLRHPNIVHTFGGKCEGDQRFYAMELIDSGTLDDLIQEKGKLSVDSTVAYGIQMCEGLAHAHEKGIIHRDVKPGNFLITRNGTVKLSDFGLAIVAAASKLTAAGKTMGTFRYMAPEQIRGKPEPCPQTDLYALGAVLFEMLTGRVPFEAETPAEILHQHLKTPAPRVSRFEPNVPRALDDLIDQLLKKPIEERPQSASEVANRLRSLDDRSRSIEVRSNSSLASSVDSEMAPPLPKISLPSIGKSSGGVPLWAVAVPTLLFLIAAYWGWSRGDSVEAVERVETHLLQFARGASTESSRSLALETLGLLGSAGEKNLETLEACLDDPDPLVRAAAAKGLGAMGVEARRSSGRLLKLAREDDRMEVRTAATEAHHRVTDGRSVLTGN